MPKQLASIFLSIMALHLTPIAVIEPPDPMISDLRVFPTAGPAGSIYTISLRITNPEEIVPLLHQMREGRESIDVPIRDDGLQGDAKKGDGVYTGHSEVPPTAARQTHRFEVFIQDRAGRKSNLLEYRFTVLDGKAI